MLNVAILDMYNGTPNQGMRAIKELLDVYADEIQYTVYDVRVTGDVPSLDYDIYISTGGPGDPRRSTPIWHDPYYGLLDDLFAYNATAEQPKYVFFICHSFQMVCRHLGIGKITKRHRKSFGTFPVHKTAAGVDDDLFLGLDDPFTVADFRYYQVISPDHERIHDLGADILLLEKDRPHVPYERAIMGLRFSPTMVAVQFHPEADAQGMYVHFTRRKNKKLLLESIGEERYLKLVQDLEDPEKIEKTHSAILPRFIETAIAAVSAETVV